MLGLGGVCFFNILVSQPNHQNRLLTKSVLPSSVTQAVKRAKSPLLRYSNWLLLTGAAQHSRNQPRSHCVSAEFLRILGFSLSFKAKHNTKAIPILLVLLFGGVQIPFQQAQPTSTKKSRLVFRFCPDPFCRCVSMGQVYISGPSRKDDEYNSDQAHGKSSTRA